MSNNAVPSIPPLSSIKDDNVRVALQSIVDAWKVRSGDVGDGSNKFLTAADISDAFKSINIEGATGGALGGLNGERGYNPSITWVRNVLQTIDNYIQQSRLWKDLTAELGLITDDIYTNRAAIETEQTTRQNADSALTQVIDTNVAAINGTLAGLQTQYNTLATSTGANASAITSLQTTVSGVNSTAQSALSLAQTTSGSVSGSWTVKFNANGYVVGAGLGLEGKNGSYTSQFVVVSDRFMVARPDGSNPIPMLTIGAYNGVNYLGFSGTILGANGYFSGDLNASGGTFRGTLAAATGTFAGSLTAGVVDLSSIVGQSYSFTSAGSWNTLYVPTGYTSMRVTMIGAGGGGGVGSYGEWNVHGGGGGGGGAGQFILAAWDNLNPGTPVNIYVGVGGGGATELFQSGGTGGESYVNYNGGRLATAAGGGGGGNAGYSGWVDHGYGEENGGGGYGWPGGQSGQSTVGGQGATPTGGWGTGGSGRSNASGLGGSGFGAGGAGGGYDGGTGNYGGGSSNKYDGWHPGGSGSGGKVIVEFYNPNAVVLRTEFTNVVNRVTSLENDKSNFWQQNANMTSGAVGSLAIGMYQYGFYGWENGGWTTKLVTITGGWLGGAWRDLCPASGTWNSESGSWGQIYNLMVRYA